MSWFANAFSSTIGKKVIMALTGLFLVIFLLEHLLANFLLLSNDPHDFNAFSEFMSTNIFIRVAEYILFAGFIIHIVYAGIVTYKNSKARPIGYAVNHPNDNSTWVSRNMGLTGAILLVFLLVHLNSFFFPHKLPNPISGHAVLEPYQDAHDKFSNPLYTAFYVVCMLILAFHLNHGFQSSFQTLGARHPKYTPIIKVLGWGFSILVPLGFAFIPLYILLTR